MVAHASRVMRRLGVRPEMPVAEALALPGVRHPVQVERYCPDQDRAQLEALATLFHAFSPVVGLEATEFPSSIQMDVTGSAPRWGGVETLVRELSTQCQRMGYYVRLAVAPTMAAAWAVARYGPATGSEGFPLVAPHELAATLGGLPLEALRLPSKTLTVLRSLGLERIEQLRALPRPALACRLGPLVLQRLDQLTGKLTEPLAAHRPPPVLRATFAAEYPLHRQDQIETALRQLAHELIEQLGQVGLGAIQLHCRATLQDRSHVDWRIDFFQATLDASRFVTQLARRLENQSWREPVVELALTARATARLTPAQRELWGTSQAHGPALGELMECLSNRLGTDRVLAARPLEDFQPEKAYRLIPWLGIGQRPDSRLAKHATPPMRPGKRSVLEPANQVPLAEEDSFHYPLVLFASPRMLEEVRLSPEGHPASFLLERQRQPIQRCWGPERIETGWWRQGLVRRDYYQIENHVGGRYWIFQDLHTGTWYLHGEYR